MISWIELNIITAIIDDVNYIKLALFCMIPNKTIDTQANITLFTLSSNPGRGKIRESESLERGDLFLSRRLFDMGYTFFF